MKTFNSLFNSNRLFQKFSTYLAATATVAIIAAGASVWLAKTNAGAPPGQREGIQQEAALLLDIYNESQVAELDQLAADFHGALSYGGNITAMASLWTDNSSLTFNNGTPYIGKTAVLSFFTSGGYFLNNWVSLAPEYKTVISVRGITATISTQCVAIDLNASPMVVKSVIQVNATAVKYRGKWLFTSMNNASGATL